MKKRIFALLLCLIMCFGVTSTAFASNDWYIDSNGNIYQKPTTPVNPPSGGGTYVPVSYTHLRAHET